MSPPPGPMAESAGTSASTGSSEESAPQAQSPDVDVAPSAPSSASAPSRASGPAQNIPGTTRSTGPASGNTTPPGQAQPGGDTPAVPAPMLIYVADIDMQTARDQVIATLERITESATAMGGYLLRRTDNSVQVRVPSARFRESLRRVEEYGEVMHRSVTAQDVSEEFRDLEVRLLNLRAVRRRLEEFLARAGSMADALSVERELERVTREIDTIEGRMRFLSTRVSFSLVTVTVRPRPEPSMAAGPAMPPRRVLQLPVQWFQRIGIERLLNTGY